MSIEKILTDFVSSKEPGAIVLKGRWGVGKTHFWKNRIASQLLDKPWKKKYSYVSLFGINSLSELKAALAVATDEFDRDAIRNKRLGSKWIGWFWRALKWVSDILQLAPRIGSQLSKVYERIGFLLVKERTISFDDIERRGKGLELNDFLGLVSFLVEQKKCRVVAIVNSDQFSENDQKVWDLHREKVFNGEINYAPTLEETISLGLREDVRAPWYGTTYSSLKELKVSNIRLVERTARYMRLIWSEFHDSELRGDVAERIAKVIPLLVWSTHGRGEGAPPLEYLKDVANTDFFTLDRKKEDQRTPQEKEWTRILNDYGYSFEEGLDYALATMIENGIPDRELIAKSIDDFEARADFRLSREAWHDSWGLYHDSVTDNGEEIISAFEKNWPPVAAHEHSTNLESAVRIMRLLNRPDLATSFIKLWVDARKGKRIEELSPRELHMFKKLDDAEILGAIENAIQSNEEIYCDLDEAFRISLERDYPPQEALRAFAKASQSELVSVLKNSQGKDFMRTVKKLANLRDHPEGSREKIVGEKFWRACSEIALVSALNADRMNNWLGISSVDRR